jgi:hypothetical protein
MRSSVLAVALLTLVCLAAAARAQTAAPPQGSAKGRAAATDANGFTVGDRVQILTGFGWIDGTIVSANGNNYRVRAQTGPEITKRYPEELRRIGGPTLADKAAGQYSLHDKVQVHVAGAWLDGELTTTLGTDYHVSIAGNRTVWATSRDLRSQVLSERAGRAEIRFTRTSLPID